MLERDDSWNGEQYLVFWVQPAGIDRAILPPGIERLPEPGEVALSPALAELRNGNPELMRRFPRWFEVSQTGVVSAGELFAYARAGNEPGIRNSRSVLRVTSFGGSSSSGEWQLVLDPPPKVAPIWLAVGALGLFPAAILVGSAAGGASSVRERRLRLLARLGAPVSHLRTISALEAAILSAPGAFAGLLGWLITARLTTEIPIVNRPVFASDMSLNAAVLVAVPVAMIVVAALLAGLSARVAVRAAPAQNGSKGLWRSVPMLIGVSMSAYGAFAGGYQRRLLFLAGVLAVLGANVVLAPVLVQRVGAVLGRSRLVVLQLAGKRMEHDPRRWTHPFVAAGSLAILGFVVVGELAIFRQDEPSRPASEVAIATVRWQHQGPEDLVNLSTAWQPEPVYPVSLNGPEIAVGASCSALAGIFGFTDCRSNSPYALSDQAEVRLASALRVSTDSLRLIPAEEIESVSAAIVLRKTDAATLHEDARTAAMRSLTAPTVVSEVTFASRPSPLVAWLFAGLAVAGTTLGLAATVAAVDRSLGAVAPRALLLKLGVSRKRLRMLEASVFGASFATIVGSSAVFGALVASLMVSQTAAGIPVGAFARLSLAIVAAGLFGAGVFWTFHRVESGHSQED